jgi:ABC-type glutathione transport system ATPase component
MDDLDRYDRAQHIMKIDEDVMKLLVPHFTVGEQLIIAELARKRAPQSFLYPADRKQSKDAIMESLQNLSIDPKNAWHKRIHELSSGLQQNIALAMLYIRKPSVALLDEPTVNLDVQNRGRCFISLRQLAENHNAIVVVVCHDLSLVAKHADAIYIMKHGLLHQMDAKSVSPSFIAEQMGLI